MMTKTFEIRDRSTFIPALAVRLDPGCERDHYLLARAGYGVTPDRQHEYVMLAKLAGDDVRASHDPYDWSNRTMQTAHQHIIDHFDKLASGAVIDVEFILGETAVAKVSEAMV